MKVLNSYKKSKQIQLGESKMFNKRNHRLLSALLCISLCVGSLSLNTLAKEADTSPKVPTAEEYNVTKSATEKNTIKETSESGFTAEKPNLGESSLYDSPTEQSSAPESEETAIPPETTGQESSRDEAETVESSAVESETETIPAECTPTESSAEEETCEETDSEALTTEESTEKDADEELTTKELPTEEATTEALTTEEALAVDQQRSSDMEEALTAFHELLLEKQLMALLYHTDSYEVQRHAGSYDDPVAVIQSGHTLYINDAVILDDQIWYQVSFFVGGEEQTGYIEAYYLAYADEDWIAWETEYLNQIYPTSTIYGITAYSTATNSTDTSDIDAFPAMYQESLKALKTQHPTWTFVPMNTDLDFDTTVNNELGVKSLIQNTKNNASKGWVGDPCPSESGWYYATKPAIAYYMNPCNFLTETYIFQFEQLTFNSTYHNVAAIQTFLNNTFMKGNIPDDSQRRTYAQAFYEIGKNRKLSPIHLASRVYQEQGNGNSALISGTYQGYEGYYNYFNVGVSGSSTEEKIKKGLEYAKSKGWNTRYKSLEGGAATIGNNYILKGQDTIYLEKFNVDTDSPYGLYNHQYMQNIQAPASESSSTRKMYAGAGSLDSGFVFKIPVFKNMPGEKSIQEIALDKTELVLYRPDTITGNQPDQKSADTLSVRFTPSDTTDDRSITWSSSNSKIVSVTPDETTQWCTVNALASGEVTITATSSNGKTAKCRIRVEAPIYSLSLTNLNTESDTPSTSATIYIGKNLTLTADYMPKDTTSDTTIVWSSSNPAVASVANGRVTALSMGTATISATIAGITASYDVIVESCKVTFMSYNYTKVLKELDIAYGTTLSSDDFPTPETVTGKVFLGWYTDQDGKGKRFDTDTPVTDKALTIYPYFMEQGKGFYVVPVGDYTYTGSAIKPDVKVYDSVSYADGTGELMELVSGNDYTITYKNNKNVNTSAQNTPTITVKGKGNYTGTESVSFNILPKSLEEHDICADHITVAYNGKVQKSSPTVYRDGKKLTANKDYTVTYPQTTTGAYKSAGSYPIVIKGKGNYTGTITVYETISKKTMLSKVNIAKIPNQVYQNSVVDKTLNKGIEPEKLTVTYQNTPLVESTDGGKTGDYTVSYTNNMAIGTATATITAVDGSAFAGSKKVTYKIVGTSISKAKVNGITPKTYTGNTTDVMQNGVSLVINDILLKESKDNGATGDYVVSYANISKTGTATVIFKGVNEYSGQIKKTYKITGYDISNGANAPSPAITMAYYTENAPDTHIPVDSISEITSPYIKGKTKPRIVLYYHGTALTYGTDYTVKYANNAAVTTAETAENKLPKLTITGKGNFKGSFQGTWTITDGAMSDTNGKLSMTAKDVVYKNKTNSYKTTLALTDANGSKLTAGKDYDKNVIYTYADGSRKGEPIGADDIPETGTLIRATVTGIGPYAGSGNATLSATYRIVAADLSKAKVTVTSQIYQNGRAVTLTGDDITVRLNGTELIYGKDYAIDEKTYLNNTLKGNATVVLRGIGQNYGGEKKITFKITSKKIAWWK